VLSLIFRFVELGMLCVPALVCLWLSMAFAGERRDRAGLWFVVLTSIACLCTLLCDMAPGRLASVFFGVFFLCLLASPVLLVVGVVFLVRFFSRGRGAFAPMAWLRGLGFTGKKIALWVLLLVGTYGLVRLGMPERVGFALSRSSFGALVDDAPTGGYGGVELKRFVGVYHVDAYGADPRGGVFFRVHSSSFMIDTDSYGFAYLPNFKGTPFGSAGYRTWELAPGWYGFAVNNDY